MTLQIKNASGSTEYQDAGGSGTSGDPWRVKVVPSDTSGNVATDDAAAAGPLYTMAALYQATADLVDNGDVGRVRMTQRRGLVAVRDFQSYLYGDTDPGIEVSNSLTSGYTTLVDGDLSYSTFTAGVPRYIRISMNGFSAASISLINNLGVTVDVNLYLDMTNSGGYYSVGQILIASQSAIGHLSRFTALPYDDGSGGVLTHYVPALQAPAKSFIIGITPSSTMSSGYIALACSRR